MLVSANISLRASQLRQLSERVVNPGWSPVPPWLGRSRVPLTRSLPKKRVVFARNRKEAAKSLREWSGSDLAGFGGFWLRWYHFAGLVRVVVAIGVD